MKKPTLNMNSNRLFHFMPTMTYLIETLTKGVPYTWQGERIPGKNLAYFTQAACFCDIPMHAISVHVDTYGAYGIGVSKDAVRRFGASPVMYVHSDTPFLKTSTQKLKTWLFQNKEVACRLKPFEGYPMVNVQSPMVMPRKKVVYYNEREWRALPNDYTLDVSTCSTLAEIANRKNALTAGAPTSPNRMKFCILNDIEYIIIPGRKDLPQLLAALSTMPVVTQQDVLPKILFYDRIKSDL